MKRLMFAALLSGAALAHAQSASAPAPAPAPVSAAKKELVQKLLVLQQPGVEKLAAVMVEQPASRMMQEAVRALQQQQIAPEKRDAMGKSIETDIRKFVEESVPIVRERAVKLAPSTIGAVMEEKFSEDELKQLVAWLESPVNKKYAQLGPEIQNGFTQKLVAESRPLIDPRLQALETKVRATLGVPAPAPGGSAPAKAATPAKKAASK